MPGSCLLDELLAAHGGADALDGITAFDVGLRAGGFAFSGHFLPARFDLAMRIEVESPRVHFTDLFGRGDDATFTPERVTLGAAARDDPRRNLHSLKVRWDELDFVYFVGYATWNYILTPWLLTRPGVRVEELSRRRLRARFPPSIPTHSPAQVFHVGEDGLLARLDYTALAFGRWARAAHVCREHRSFGGIVAPTSRRVTPRIAGRPMPGPTLVFIELERLDAVR